MNRFPEHFPLVSWEHLFILRFSIHFIVNMPMIRSLREHVWVGSPILAKAGVTCAAVGKISTPIRFCLFDKAALCASPWKTETNLTSQTNDKQENILSSPLCQCGTDSQGEQMTGKKIYGKADYWYECSTIYQLQKHQCCMFCSLCL